MTSTVWEPFPNRQTWQADAILRGWTPQRTLSCDGIFNTDLNLGFGVEVRAGGVGSKPSFQVYRIGNDPMFTPEISWADLSDEILRRIVWRLSEGAESDFTTQYAKWQRP